MKADIIVQCGVHFMAETSKILNPEKTVLIPDLRAGCSLASSITGADVRLLRERFPGVPVVTYVNTSADVKAESDICCTSSNAVQVVESLGVDKVIFLPDEYLAHYVATQTTVKIIAWKGHCEVHERFTGGRTARCIARTIPASRSSPIPNARRTCWREADFTGSTSGMIDWVRKHKPAQRRHGHRMLDGRQRAAELPDVEVRPPVQSLPAHEAHHAAEDSRQPRLS